MRNTKIKLDLTVIGGHDREDKCISLPIYLGDRLGRRKYFMPVGSLEDKELVGTCDAVSEANKQFCRTDPKGCSRISREKSALCENLE